MNASFDPDEMDPHRFPINEWALTEAIHDVSDLGVTETLFSVSNGYLGLRGNVEEGRESHTHGTFINGLHEIWPIQHAEEAYGFARVGQTIVNAPDAKIIRLYVDDEPLLLSVADLEQYSRTLDFKDGVLRREILWRTPSGKQVSIKSERLVSFPERHLAAFTYEVTLLDAEAPVVISSQVLNRQDGQDEYHVPTAAMGEGFDPRQSDQMQWRVLNSELHRSEDARYALGYRITHSGMTLAVTADHELATDNEYYENSVVDGDVAKHIYHVDAKPGVPIKLIKWVSYHTSRGVPSRELVDRGYRTLDRAIRLGYEEIADQQRRWLNVFWDRSDVQVPGHPRVQQAIRWCLFQIAQATARAEGHGIPAKGLTGSGYSGHYFWDTEVYVLPFLTYTNPEVARNALRFRYHMLDAARSRAVELNQLGALYPWRTINGEEASAYYAAGTAQYHINADIVHALCQYVQASGDIDFLVREGIDILVETARMWADLGFWRGNPHTTFHIHGVTGPDEYTTVVNDNLFTNVMARSNLKNAAHYTKLLADEYPDHYEQMIARLELSDAEVTEWEAAAAAMYIPYDSTLEIHPQDAAFLEKELWDLENTDPAKRPLLLHFHPLVIYRFQVIKQADVVLGLFLQSDQFTLEEKRADFDYYDPLTTGDSTLSAVVQSIIAAEVGYADLALDYFHAALFVDLADLHRNAADGVHVASTGGIWSALVSGFGGFRDNGGVLRFEPRLPASWAEMRFSLQVKGLMIRVLLTHDELIFTPEAYVHTPSEYVPTNAENPDAPEPVTVWVCGHKAELRAGQEVRMKLSKPPLLTGAPSMDDIEGELRADGTVMTAMVPEGGEAHHMQ